MPFNKLLSTGSYDFVTIDEFGKNDWPFFWPLVLAIGSFLALFWTRFDPLAKRRSGNTAVSDNLLVATGICCAHTVSEDCCTWLCD